MISQHPDTQNSLDLLREMEDIEQTSEQDWSEVDADNHTIQLVHTAQTLPYTNDDYQLEVSQMDHDSYMNAEYIKHSDDNNAEKQPTKLRKHKDSQTSSNHGARKQTTQLVAARSQKKSAKRTEEEPKEQTFSILCKSPPHSLRRQNLELPLLSSRGTSGGNGRRASLVKSIHIVEQEEEDDRKEDFHKDNNMSLTEKRMAMTRDRFSAKNLFNVKRQNTGSYFTDAHTGKSDHSSDGVRKAMSAMTMSQQQSFSQGQSRPKTSVATFQGRRVHSNGSARGNLRPALSASRQVEYGEPQFSTGADYSTSRHPRSRRQLEKLSRMKVDPFGQDDVQEEVPAPVESWMPRDVHQDLLERLRRRGPLLQRRVTSFLKDLEDFNRRCHKSGLDHILEIT